jgi:hypothetical protein
MPSTRRNVSSGIDPAIQNGALAELVLGSVNNGQNTSSFVGAALVQVVPKHAFESIKTKKQR